jgi:hypothetical protein
MAFECDDAKYDGTLRACGLGQHFAALVFAGPVIERPEAGYAYG